MRKIICYLFGHKYDLNNGIGKVQDVQREGEKISFTVKLVELTCHRCGHKSVLDMQKYGCFFSSLANIRSSSSK